jgi:hypothetical protein
MNLKSIPEIHFFTLHPGEHPGDMYTPVAGLVTCKYCLQKLKSGIKSEPGAFQSSPEIEKKKELCQTLSPN